MRKLSIIGSTGSIGKKTLKVVSKNPNEFKVETLAAKNNIIILEKQAREYNPKIVVAWDEEKARELRKRLRNTRIKVLSGDEGLVEAVKIKSATHVVFSLSGIQGLIPLFAAMDEGKNIAIANKELLVIAGSLIKEKIRKKKISFVPIDSEHCAIFQCLEGNEIKDVRKIIITASGGPFVDLSREKLAHVSPAEALRHPRWKMGRKISIDSATMMNKGLEVIEASVLYGIPVEKIEVVVHRQSIVHSMVEFNDGNVIAQLSSTDMYFPISFALSYPRRLPYSSSRLDLVRLGTLEFEKPQYKKFPSLGLAYKAALTGGTMTTVLNAANEVAVNLFLNNKIKFIKIPKIVAAVMKKHSVILSPKLKDIIKADNWAREESEKLC